MKTLMFIRWTDEALISPFIVHFKLYFLILLIHRLRTCVDAGRLREFTRVYACSAITWTWCTVLVIVIVFSHTDDSAPCPVLPTSRSTDHCPLFIDFVYINIKSLYWLFRWVVGLNSDGTIDVWLCTMYLLHDDCTVHHWIHILVLLAVMM